MKTAVPKRLVVVSNRLPVAIEQGEHGWHIGPVAGGLITALGPVMAKNRGLWIGWPGCDRDVPYDPLIYEWNDEHAYNIVPVPLTETDVSEYYRGFANETLWPLFHDALGRARFHLPHWEAYRRVNERFAQIVTRNLLPGDFIWVHDYQLALVGQGIKEHGARQPVSFFLHIPFPASDLFRRLPWKREIIEALLSYDQIGFQTVRDRRNFVQCVRELVPNAEVVVRGRETVLHVAGHRVRAGHFPISIDFREFNDGAASTEIAAAAANLRGFYSCERLILGVDRLDYTKGIIERFSAFERALEKYPDLLGRVSLIQLVIPSRTNVPEYQRQKSLLDELTGQINGRFTQEGWVPIHYMYRHMDRPTLLAHYRACEIAIITPLRDGMNLVAKEYCASTIDGNGVLILSEFAGAADQLAPHTLCVNPYDCERTADAIYEAFNMSASERRKRMNALRSEVRRNNVQRWLGQILGAGILERRPSRPNKLATGDLILDEVDQLQAPSH